MEEISNRFDFKGVLPMWSSSQSQEFEVNFEAGQRMELNQIVDVMDRAAA